MITLLALFFMSKYEPIITPSYKVGKCYAENGSENFLKITGIKKETYEYTKYYLVDRPFRHWTYVEKLENNFDTIEIIYEKEIKCP